MTSKENKNYKRKDPKSSEQIQSHETTVVKMDSDTDIVEGGILALIQKKQRNESYKVAENNSGKLKEVNRIKFWNKLLAKR